MHSNNFFTIKIVNNICPWHSIFNFFNHKNVFRPNWSTSFTKNIFAFWYSYMITDFKFTTFIITFFLPESIHIVFNINRLHFYCNMICIYWLFHLIYQYTHFLILASCACKLYFQSPDKSFSNNRFFFIMCLIHFYTIIV